MTKEELKEKAHSLPLHPGVYIMMDAANTVIYVGKAKALRNRVSQYFLDLASHTEKTRAMVSQIDHFDVILADSEFEALVLECSLIKRHKPKYNILLKDDKEMCIRDRKDMERFMGTKVYLQTWVKVKENWRDSLAGVHNMGYREDD